MMTALLDIKDLRVEFPSRRGHVVAIENLTLQLSAGEILGVVGESGAGKSTIGNAVIGLLEPPGEMTAGQIMLQGERLDAKSAAELRAIRGNRIGMIFQDPLTSLDPLQTVEHQLTNTMQQHLNLNDREAREQAISLIEQVGIPEPATRIMQYPHQFSGGMRQRVMIAMALACQPKVLIADEPTTALDVTIQAQILELVKDLRKDQGMGIIWITHDLGVVAGIADRVIVMYAGKIVEHAPVRELFKDPRHPYTRALLAAMPGIEIEREGRLHSIGGQPPSLTSKPASCSFAPRCEHAFGRCRDECPPLVEVSGSHQAACWLEHPQYMEPPSEMKIRESF